MTAGPGSEGRRSDRWLPYVLAGVGLIVGLAVVFVGPFPWRAANLTVGGLLLAAALGAVSHLVVRGSGPGGRGPDF